MSEFRCKKTYQFGKSQELNVQISVPKEFENANEFLSDIFREAKRVAFGKGENCGKIK